MSIFTNTTIASSFEEPRGAGGRQPIVGELIFDSFIKKEEGQEHETIDFFNQDDENLTPIFENATVSNANASPSEWGSLFDNEIPISSEDVFTFTPQQPVDEGSQAEEPELEISTKSFLPTPIFEEAKLTSKTCVAGGRVSKKGSPKVDHLGVTSYNRKVRTTPLSPVVADSDDPAALKRARNTEAARRSRARKTQRMNELELKVEQLLKRNHELEQEIQRLNSIIRGK
ncbi:hypothetical protein HG536_0F03050 [Torulaspora globosa]|uniref:BZIP domain-containing protein n=1 Tax=Torulaspora globosa TaxID=48254 RepID=A0A7G3ZKE4_9SACH|nr:uncharacterized protein HG536_0F03050 [Torulaspora globosa]QLL33980.1 hypothetical protein HG536_0F03050 [Torulaspora globosa]